MEKKDLSIAKDAEDFFDAIKKRKSPSIKKQPSGDSIQINGNVEGNVNISVNIYKSH